MKRILIYSHDTFGLGNIRRMLAIAQHLVTSDPELNILIASGSPMLHAFRLSAQIDYLKLPCLKRTCQGEYTVKSLGLTYDSALRLRANVLTSTILDYEPDLILVDKKPFGVGNELRPALEMVARYANRPKLVLLLRDILDSPQATIPIWEKNGYHAAIDALYDQVLVVGSPELYDLGKEYRFPASSTEKIRFCGLLKREPGRRSRTQIRAELGLEQEPLVLVTAGGGEDGNALLAAYLNGLRTESQAPAFHTVLICGPELPEAKRREILNLVADCPQLTVKEFSDDLMGDLDAADLVVSMAGYNTICEILTLKKRAIVVPRVKPVQEQWIRAQCLARHGLLRTIHPDDLTGARLLKAVHQELDRRNVFASGLYQVDMNGMDRIAGHLGELLHSRTPSRLLTQRVAELG